MNPTLLLSSADVARTLDADEARRIVAASCVQLIAGELVLPPRTQLTATAPGRGAHLVMSALDPNSAALTTKLISVCPSNAEHELPTSFGLLILQDASTGRPIALIHSPSLTALRTAALVANSVEALALRGAARAVIFGAGPVASAALDAITRVRTFGHVEIITKSRDSGDAFVAERLDHYPQLGSGADVESAVRSADVIVTATTASEPLFDGAWLKPGTHIAAVGAFTPTTRELDSFTVEGANIVVDTEAGARDEAGDLLIPLAEGRIDDAAFRVTLGDVLSGRKTGRQSDTSITVFKSVGSAAFDVGVATHVARRAKELGLGTPIDLG